MAHIITRPCCNDASCVSVCPVNCIHPTPDEPEFLTAEQLYIDPETCIDCGACIDECPVEAIFPDDQIETKDEPYLQINADYYKDHEVDGGLVPPKKAPPMPADKPLHVAIVGAGPAALYAAQALVAKTTVAVDVFDRLPTPHGLVRFGVAPDHPATKLVERGYLTTANKKNFTYYLNVKVGEHIKHSELAERYHAVIYAVGAATDKRLGVPGEDLPGSVSATEFVAWYNGHPDYADFDVDLSGERAVVVGNGNVALDVARILVTDPDALAKTDIATHALEKLRESNIREVVVLGRRGIAQAAYTNSEFLALGDVEGVDVIVHPDELVLDPASQEALDNGELDSTIGTKLRLAQEFSARPATEGNRRIVFRFLSSPVSIDGEGKVESVTIATNAFGEDTGRVSVSATGESDTVETGLVLRSIGYKGHAEAVPDLPFDDGRGVVPNEGGRVLDGDAPMTGVYVTGWIKRGATGGIGRNRMCGEETAEAVLLDFIAEKLVDPSASREDVGQLASDRGARPIGLDGWKNIDKAEKAAGREAGRPRVKFTDLAALEAAAESAD